MPQFHSRLNTAASDFERNREDMLALIERVETITPGRRKSPQRASRVSISGGLCSPVNASRASWTPVCRFSS